MNKLDIIRNVFSRYKYMCIRPNNIPNNEGYADTANFIGWYMQEFMNIPSINREDIFTWTIYTDLDYSRKQIYEGLTQDIPFSTLEENDIILFSTNPRFDAPDYNNYWGGIYIDSSTFVNFNSNEGLGTQSLISYINNPNTEYRYCVVFRIKTLNGVKDNPPPLGWDKSSPFFPNSPFNK